MNLQIIQQLITLVENSSLQTVEIQDNQQTIRIVNSSAKARQNIVPFPTVAEQVSTPTINQAEHTIFSPVVGRLHLTPDAVSPPLIQVGDIIKPHDTLGWVSVLNRLLPIKSDKAGKIQAILVENYQGIEYDTALFKISEA